MAYSLLSSSSTLIPISVTATSSVPEIPTNTTAPTSLGTTASTTSACSTPASDVWNYFKRIEGEPKARCTKCGNVYAYRGGTTNLRNHLLAKHSSMYKAADDKTQRKLTFKAQKCSKEKEKEITYRILYMICEDLRPVRMVECTGFKSLMSYLEPGYQIPSRKYFTRLLQQQYLSCKEVLITKFEKEAVSIALTTDIWTSRAVEVYITVTAHYLDPSWKMQSYVLQTSAFPERHTGIEIAGKLKDISDHFKITSKVSVTVHDQASNMLNSLDLLESELGWKSLKCSAHCLQLCLKPDFEIPSINRLLAAARKLVGHFNHSVVATEALKRKHQQMNSDTNHKFKKLIKDCSTRWNSSFFMLERLLQLHWPITAVLSDETVTKRSDRYLDLKTEQWNLASELIKVLKPFDVATTFFSYEEGTTISCILPILHGVVQSLSFTADDSTSIRTFKDTVSKDIKRRWELDSYTSDNILLLSSMLDPRFKDLTFVPSNEKEALKDEIVKRLEKIKEDQDKNHGEESSDEEIQSKTKKQKPSALDYLLGPETEKSGLTAREELDTYLTEVEAPRSTSPTLWWKSNNSRFPLLCRIAMAFLNIPATSTPSERVFSTAGNTVTQQRSCLKPKNVDAIIFLNKNIDLFSM